MKFIDTFKDKVISNGIDSNSRTSNNTLRWLASNHLQKAAEDIAVGLMRPTPANLRDVALSIGTLATLDALGNENNHYLKDTMRKIASEFTLKELMVILDFFRLALKETKADPNLLKDSTAFIEQFAGVGPVDIGDSDIADIVELGIAALLAAISKSGRLIPALIAFGLSLFRFISKRIRRKKKL